MLSGEPDLHVIAEVGSGEDAVRLATELHPDVVLMDLRLPGIDGVAATARIVAAGAGGVLVLTTYAAGATGYLLKDAPRDQLAQGVRGAARGETVLAPALTAREVEVLGCIARGMSNPDTGRALFISEATVKSHVTRILEKLGVKDRTAAVTAAIAGGILPSPRPGSAGG